MSEKWPQTKCFLSNTRMLSDNFPTYSVQLLFNSEQRIKLTKSYLEYIHLSVHINLQVILNLLFTENDIHGKINECEQITGIFTTFNLHTYLF